MIGFLIKANKQIFKAFLKDIRRSGKAIVNIMLMHRSL